MGIICHEKAKPESIGMLSLKNLSIIMIFVRIYDKTIGDIIKINFNEIF
jgi:hypothetical protein